MEFVFKRGWFKQLLQQSRVIPITILFFVCCTIFVLVTLFSGYQTSDDSEPTLTMEQRYNIDAHIIEYINYELSTKYKDTIKFEIDKVLRDVSGGVALINDEYVLVKSDSGCYSYRHAEFIDDNCYDTKEGALYMLNRVITKNVYRTRHGKDWYDIER